MTTKINQTAKIFHPILFSLYPVLFLMSANLGEIPFQESWRAIVFVPIISAIIWLGLKLIIRDNQKAALVTTILLLSFFSYGHVYTFLGEESVLGGVLKRHRYLIPFFAGTILLSSWWIMKKARNLDSISQTFNIIGLALIILPVYQIALFETRSFSQEQVKNVEFAGEIDTSSLTSTMNYPDIYYIILDSYGREDALLELFNYDNSSFLSELRDVGFVVAGCSTSNYGKTVFSLASSLNMNYLDQLDSDTSLEMPNGDPNLIAFRSLIKDSEVRRFLEAKGYTTVAFANGYHWTEWDDADYYFSYSESVANGDIFKDISAPVNDFEALLIETSAGMLFYDLFNITDIDFEVDDENEKKITKDYARRKYQYDRVSYTLNILEGVSSSIESPKLIFVHLIPPHGPFVFAADGGFISNQKDINPGYLDQITFLNKSILAIIGNILQSSELQPVIIIQGDHGPPETNFGPSRLAIFNAYYLPEEGDKNLYESITPVNSFRVILDHYFGTNYGLLDDIVRNSVDKDDLFNFKIVPNTCQGE